MQATVEVTEQEYKALESHVKKAVMMDKTDFMSLTVCDKILGRLYLALKIQKAPRKTDSDDHVEKEQ